MLSFVAKYDLARLLLSRLKEFTGLRLCPVESQVYLSDEQLLESEV